jgi:solute carrier family 9B (sodium/hydrogen exchanger), member 1/2
MTHPIESGQFSREELTMMETHDDILKEKRLPRVGQIVRSKKSGTLWRVMEKREVWQNGPEDPATGQSHLLPAVYLLFWQVQPGVPSGVGKMLGYAYTLHDNTFESNWEVVE